MNSPRGTVLLAVVLLIAGQLGWFVGETLDAPFFSLTGLIAIVAMAVLLIGEAFGAITHGFRSGLNEPRKKNPKRDGEYRGTVDGKPVPDPEKRAHPAVPAKDYRAL